MAGADGAAPVTSASAVSAAAAAAAAMPRDLADSTWDTSTVADPVDWRVWVAWWRRSSKSSLADSRSVGPCTMTHWRDKHKHNTYMIRNDCEAYIDTYTRSAH